MLVETVELHVLLEKKPTYFFFSLSQSLLLNLTTRRDLSSDRGLTKCFRGLNKSVALHFLSKASNYHQQSIKRGKCQSITLNCTKLSSSHNHTRCAQKFDERSPIYVQMQESKNWLFCFNTLLLHARYMARFIEERMTAFEK